MSSVEENGVYRYYKGGEVRVKFVAHLASTGDRYVVYQDRGNGKYYIRSEEEFCAEIDSGGERVPRFEYVGE